MPITQNFQLNSLANQFSSLVYQNVKQENGGDWFMLDADGEPIRINIIGGAKGMRDIVDAFALQPIKDSYPQWESVGISLMKKCLDSGSLTKCGREIWQSMVNDMGGTVAGGRNA